MTSHGLGAEPFEELSSRHAPVLVGVEAVEERARLRVG